MVLAAAVVLGLFIFGAIFGASFVLAEAVQNQKTTVRYMCLGSDGSEIKPVMMPKPKTRKGKQQ